MTKLTKQEQFFYDNAGYSYDPETETPEQGRTHCARQLAAAETKAAQAGVYAQWMTDPHTDSSDWSDDPEPWATWCVTITHPETGQSDSLGGVDFGRDGEPWGNPYARVVEAELALDMLCTYQDPA